jgi:hypothetical protein
VSRAPGQGDADHLEAVTVSRYTFHRPMHRSARHRRRTVNVERPVEPDPPPAALPRNLPVSLPLAIAVLVAFVAANLVLTVLVAAGLH